MGCVRKPHNFSFHSDVTPRRLLVFSTLFIIAIASQIRDVRAAVDQTEQEIDVQGSCESKTLDEVPPDPVSSALQLICGDWSLTLFSCFHRRRKAYDATDVTVETAKKLSKFIAETGKTSKGQKFSQSKIDSFQKYARELANEAFSEDENLLAFALAAPSVSLAVVQFRDKVNRNITDHTFLGIYWRELGIAWNQTDGAHFWGAPFKDCGPMQGRWLWPFSVTVVVQHVKWVEKSSKGWKKVERERRAHAKRQSKDAFKNIGKQLKVNSRTWARFEPFTWSICVIIYHFSVIRTGNAS